jgi:hypothetical protein
MPLQGRLLGTGVVPPRKKIQAQRDDRGIQCEGNFGQVRVEPIVLIKTRRSSHQDLGDRLKQTPVTMAIGVGKVGAREVATESQVIE